MVLDVTAHLLLQRGGLFLLLFGVLRSVPERVFFLSNTETKKKIQRKRKQKSDFAQSLHFDGERRHLAAALAQVLVHFLLGGRLVVQFSSQ